MCFYFVRHIFKVTATTMASATAKAKATTTTMASATAKAKATTTTKLCRMLLSSIEKVSSLVAKLHYATQL